MVTKPNAELDEVFRALADPTRRAILARLARGVSTAGELSEPFGISQPAVSKHLKTLERAGLVHRTRAGRTHRFRLSAAPLESAAKWIAQYRQFWEGALDSLADFLQTAEASSSNPGD